ncbi:MAG TPA: DUF2380 domain-containing protein, partial [Bradyrhizobium sp.]
MRRAGTKAAIATIGFAAALSLPHAFAVGPAQAAAPLTIAVADFDYIDTSGEVRDQRAAHQARMARFAELLRESLTAQGEFQVQPLECADPPCTPINMQPQKFIDASR